MLGAVAPRRPTGRLGQADEQRWGGYATVFAQWELLLGRAVPDASHLDRHGKPVLAPPFVEWDLNALVKPLRSVWPAGAQVRSKGSGASFGGGCEEYSARWALKWAR